MKQRLDQRLFVLVVFLFSLIAESLLLPFARTQPRAIHEFLLELYDWQIVAATFVTCAASIYMLFALLSPRIAHLKHDRFPPTWLGLFLATMLVAFFDLTIGLQLGGYRGSWLEWLLYAFVPMILVGAHFGLIHEAFRRWIPKVVKRESKPLEGLREPSWNVVSEWLKSDRPAEFDIMDHHPVAVSLAEKLKGDSRSIGIVSPFGGGKSSVVNWLKMTLNDADGPRVLISQHSCWGFESSSSAVHEMLADAVKILNVEIDTFPVRSLPESYRKTFAAGGEWLDVFSNILMTIPDATEQFTRLSELLHLLNARIVFVVEDLDRTDTKGFEIQEVLGFLQRMREFDNLGFILTGGVKSPQEIDFEKLCDYVEVLRPIDAVQAGEMISVMYSHWCNLESCPYIRKPGMGESHTWNPTTYALLNELQPASLPEAVVQLLTTPRELRHALARIHSSWQRLKGEVNLDHLIALTSLRIGAPEAFLYLVRHWKRFDSQNPRTEKLRDVVKEALNKEWSDILSKAEWDERAVSTVISFILPTFCKVLGGEPSNASGVIQGLSEKRYWVRAVSERIAPHEIEDQRVFRETDEWLASGNEKARLIDSLCTSLDFGGVWPQLMRAYPELTDAQVRLVCGQVLNRIRTDCGASANCRSTGFMAVMSLANERIPHRPESVLWLESQIALSAGKSLALANDLWWYGDKGGFVLPDDRSVIRSSMISTLQSIGTPVVTQTLSADVASALSDLVFSFSDSGPTEAINDFRWLGNLILAAIHQPHRALAECLVHLLTYRTRRPDRQENDPIVDSDLLHGVFGANASDVIDFLGSMVDSVSSNTRPLLARVVAEGKL